MADQPVPGADDEGVWTPSDPADPAAPDSEATASAADGEAGEGIGELDEEVGDRFDEFFADRIEEDADDGGRSKTRLVIGAVILLIGIAVGVAALASQGGDDGDSDASKTEVKAATTTSGSVTTTEVPRTTIVPTTLPGGALPTGCGGWDPAFGFEPEPVEGVALYSDFKGWHVRVGPEAPPVVTGTIVGQTTPLVPTEPPPAEGVQLIADPATATVTFRITTGEQPLGFDFSADCTQKQLTFDLKDDAGQPIDPAIVQLGRDGGVTALPVIAQRMPPAG